MCKQIIYNILDSWENRQGSITSTDQLLTWIQELNRTTHVCIKESSIFASDFWFYDDYLGEVLNRKRSFFSIVGMRYFVNDEFVREQPIIIQPEIGYLGIICKKIHGVLQFLMQAKIEPGNVNCVQISPTIQATKSNFLRAHGGKLPTYFELFENSRKHCVLYDQVQSEQASRFYQKRNRNMIMYLKEDENIEVYPNFKWMTLGQIKELMKVDNLVNMDTRTVLSGLPLHSLWFAEHELAEVKETLSGVVLFNSIFNNDSHAALPSIYHELNDYKMFKDIRISTVPLNQLKDWKVDEYGITCKKQADFMVRYYDIEIAGREVQHWTQPLFKAIGSATFGLFTRISKQKREYLVRIKPEIGSFDKVELGPCIQWEPTHDSGCDDCVEALFRSKLASKKDILTDVVLSEEGGRFYHEQNRNVIIHLKNEENLELPQEYIWADYATLHCLVQMNNCLNIQLRNLMSLIDF